MGISFSNNRRRNQTYPPPPPPPHPHPYYYPPEPPLYPSQPQTPYPPPPSIYNNGYGSAPHSTSSYSNPTIGRFHYHYTPYHANQTNGWPAIRGPVGPPLQPAPYVEHQNAKKVRNDVNVHKHTLKLEVDDHNPDHQLVSFVFDALVDGSITIYYFAKEESDCKFVPVFPEAHTPKRISFQKGLGQKFRQPSGTGIDLGFFELDDLSKPSPEEDVFPLVIVAETSAQHSSSDEHLRDPAPSTSANMQITQTVVEKSEGNSFNVKVIRQILWVDGVRYELREIYGLGSTNAAASFDDGDSGKECVICMTEPKDTAVLPCRHMCMCSDCAKELRLQTNKCPICRQPIEALIEIKINSGQ